MGRRHPAGLATADGGKGVPRPVQHELEDRLPDGLAVCQQKAGRLGPGHGTVDGGQTEVERVGQFLNREPGMQGEFQNNDEILGLELHAPSILSIFQNWENSRYFPVFKGISLQKSGGTWAEDTGSCDPLQVRRCCRRRPERYRPGEDEVLLEEIANAGIAEAHVLRVAP